MSGNIRHTGGEFQWKVNNFLQRDCLVGQSPDFYFCGRTWYLLIDPCAFSIYPDDDYVPLYLTLSPNSKTTAPIKLDVCLYLETVDGKADPHAKYTFTTTFDEEFDECGSDELIAKSKLIEKKSELLPGDILTVICKLKRRYANDAAAGYASAAVNKFTQTEEKTVSTAVDSKSKVLQDFKELYLKQAEYDVIIRVKGQKFPAHQAILKARSPVLCSAFQVDMKEKDTGVLEIDDCDPSSFSDFLCFLYCGEVQNLSAENVFSLFTTADKYDVMDLRSQCLKFIKENLTVDTFCDAISLALLHSEDELIKFSTDFFAKNIPKIIVTVKWQMFLAENPTKGNELFIKTFVPNNNKTFSSYTTKNLDISKNTTVF